MGACATSTGVVQQLRADSCESGHFPVDVFVPGCPPRPKQLIHAIMMLQQKIGDSSGAFKQASITSCLIAGSTATITRLSSDNFTWHWNISDAECMRIRRALACLEARIKQPGTPQSPPSRTEWRQAARNGGKLLHRRQNGRAT